MLEFFLANGKIIIVIVYWFVCSAQCVCEERDTVREGNKPDVGVIVLTVVYTFSCHYSVLAFSLKKTTHGESLI